MNEYYTASVSAGGTISWGAAVISVTSAGNATLAGSATITGPITASTATITGQISASGNSSTLKAPTVQKITATGTYTTALNARASWVRIVGGGGGGLSAGAAAAGEGGGSGAYSEKLIDVAVRTYDVTSDAGGAGGDAGLNGVGRESGGRET